MMLYATARSSSEANWWHDRFQVVLFFVCQQCSYIFVLLLYCHLGIHCQSKNFFFSLQIGCNMKFTTYFIYAIAILTSIGHAKFLKFLNEKL